MRFNPFPLEYSSKSLGNVQLRIIWWKVKEKKPCLLLNGSRLLDFLVSMNSDVVKNDKRVHL